MKSLEEITPNVWNEIEANNVKRFQLGSHPEIIYVIKTGFENNYMVVHEDAFEIRIGEVEFFTKEQLKEKFDITI